MVGVSWCHFIDARDYPGKRFQDVIDGMPEKCTCEGTVFHLACENGQVGIAKMIIKSSGRLNIDLNAKNHFGRTAFQEACKNGHDKIADNLIKNSAEFNIELNNKDNYG